MADSKSKCYAANLNYDMMAFDNYGGGARAGANPGQACGVFDSDETGNIDLDKIVRHSTTLESSGDD